MPRIAYIDKKFHKRSLEIISYVNDIVDDYKKQGYGLTLRQVYYQLVSKNIIENKEQSYKTLGEIINNGRLAGLIDWNAIEDRTRNLAGRIQYSGPEEAIRQASWKYHVNYWEGQDTYLEVWVEKDALKGIVEQACYPLDVDFFSCRGYTSQSEMWIAAQRLIRKQKNDGHKRVVILHFGDHDPSGIDMSRDIEERLELFGVNNLEFKRLALNMDQIEEFGPPPNPTKVTDSRSGAYIAKFGRTCWELDALNPQTITKIIQNNILPYRDDRIYKGIKAREDRHKEVMEQLSRHWGQLELNLDEIITEYCND